jgi:hypothetical protein
VDKLHLGLAGLAVIAGLTGLKALTDGNAWERRARAAETFARAETQKADSLESVASAAEASAARSDTVRITLTKLVARTDSVTKPDSTCGPSLAARDQVIAAAQHEVDWWQRAYRAQLGALAALTAAKDTVATALAARSKSGLALELGHPALHLSLQAMVYPQARVGIGVSLDLVRIKL